MNTIPLPLLKEFQHFWFNRTKHVLHHAIASALELHFHYPTIQHLYYGKYQTESGYFWAHRVGLTQLPEPVLLLNDRMLPAYPINGDKLMAKFGTFENIRYQLSADEKKAVKGFAEGYDTDFLVALTELMAQDYKVSMSWSDEMVCYTLTVSGRKGHKYNSEKFMMSKHDDLTVCAFYALYKVLVVWDNGEWVDQTGEGDFG